MSSPTRKLSGVTPRKSSRASNTTPRTSRASARLSGIPSRTTHLSGPRDSNHDWKESETAFIVTEDVDDNSVMDKICFVFSKLPILNPFGKVRTTWDLIICIMLIYTSLEVPFTLSFSIELSLYNEYMIFGIIALTIDIFLLVDICLNFRTAYSDKYDDLRLITDPKRIAQRYITGWFIIDLTTSFPLEFMLHEGATANDSNNGNFTTYLKVLRIFRLFRIVKILRLLKMVRLFDGLVSKNVARDILMCVRLFKVILSSLLSAHFCACLWYYIGCSSNKVYDNSWLSSTGIISYHCGMDESLGEETSLYFRYSFSWYWSIVTLFTTGYGDIYANNPTEQWTASFVILIGTCLFGYFVGTLTSIITEGDRIKSSIVNKLEEATHFCDQKRLPPKMARAVLTHTRYHCNHNYVLGDENDVLSNLPPYLAMDVSLFISNKYLENLDFFSNDIIDPYIRGLIALKMKSISCNKGFKLFVKGDTAEQIYIQRIGKALHVHELDTKSKSNSKKYKKCVRKLVRGDVVGEYAFILKKRSSTVICETFCEFYQLNISDIIEILQAHYNTNWMQKLNKIKKFLKMEYTKPIKKRHKRRCLLRTEPLLPTFDDTNADIDDDIDDNSLDYSEDEGNEGHVDWGLSKTQVFQDIKKKKQERELNAITDEILQENDHDVDDDFGISMSLNALSRNAIKIQNLTKSQYSRKNLMNYIKNTSEQTQKGILKTKNTLFSLKSLKRRDSFERDLEVTKWYRRNNDLSDTSSSSDDNGNDGDDDDDDDKGDIKQEDDDDDNGGNDHLIDMIMNEMDIEMVKKNRKNIKKKDDNSKDQSKNIQKMMQVSIGLSANNYNDTDADKDEQEELMNDVDDDDGDISRNTDPINISDTNDTSGNTWTESDDDNSMAKSKKNDDDDNIMISNKDNKDNKDKKDKKGNTKKKKHKKIKH